MVRIYLSICFLLCLISLEVKADEIRVHTLGDSTMEQQDPNVKDQRGWPQYLQQFFTEDVRVINHAKSGTSTKSYYKGGYWERARKSIGKGDYVIIQFGHNDEKHNGVDGPVGTAPSDSFRIYLTRYVDEVRQLGAYPVLFTPVVRKMFGRDGRLSRRGKHDLGEQVAKYVDTGFDKEDTVTYNYVYNMKLVAKELHCPLVDMTALTANLVESLGQEQATELIYNLPKDGTHYGTAGALLFARLAAKGLKDGRILKNYIRDSEELVVAPVQVDWGDFYVKMPKEYIVDICCLGNDGKSGEVQVCATKGLTLTQTKGESSVSSLSLPYIIKNGIAYLRVYVRMSSETPGGVSESLTVINGNTEKKIPFAGNCLALSDSKKFSVTYLLHNHAKPISEGAVIPLEEQWEGMTLDRYVLPEVLGKLAKQKGYKQSKVQMNVINGGVWPGNEMDVVYTRYVQFGMQAVQGTSMYIDSLSLLIGGTDYRIVCSRHEDFSDARTIGEQTSGRDEIEYRNFFLDQQLNSGDTFYIRIYPWYGKPSSEARLCLHDVEVKGIQMLDSSMYHD